MFDDIVAESICEYFARQWWNRDPSALALEDIAEVFEVRVTASHGAVFELEGGDIGAANDLVVRIHVT